MFEQLPQLGAGAGGGAQPDPILSILILEMATGLVETATVQCGVSTAIGGCYNRYQADLIGLIIIII